MTTPRSPADLEKGCVRLANVGPEREFCPELSVPTHELVIDAAKDVFRTWNWDLELKSWTEDPELRY
jgi:hypothetical protein